ncbi:hypothetical protein [Agrococcus casei]|uniref:hypothetical protein n=1 Tax=Agrococcus casei TaxID=343512 RepID=UPI003F8F55D2
MSETSTQQQHPWRSAARTALQTAVVLVAAAIVAGPEIAAFVEQFWPRSPVPAWIAAAVAFLSAASGLLARLSALPAVDRLLEHIVRLGSAPGVDRANTP